MAKKKALVLCNETLLSDLVVFTLEKLLCDVDLVDNPKDAVSKIESQDYNIVVIGENKGTVVKSKLAEIIYNKAKRKPHIVIFKKVGETIPKEFYLTIIPRPNFHEALLEVVEKEGAIATQIYQMEHVDLSNYIKFPHFKKTNIFNFLKELKGNAKFHIKSKNHEILGFTMGADIFILKSTLNNIYDMLSLNEVEVAKETLNLNEFLSLTLDTKTFKSNLRDFIVNCINNTNDKDLLLTFLPKKESIVTLKAPTYIVRQVDLINQNIDIGKLQNDQNHTTIEDLIGTDGDLNKIKAVVCMYALNMIDTEEPVSSKKYDVKIKKSFLKKIIDKIRGL